MSNDTITAVPGLRVGHATVVGGGSGCTVVLGPFRAAVEVAGMATGTRELDVLDPRHLVPLVDALVLTGGSAFGLAAADGAAGWLAEQGLGFDTGVAKVPIVPAAVIFDLADGVSRPDAAVGRAACAAASAAPVAQGRIGAGTGATVGKLAGRPRSSPGGVGSAAGTLGGHALGALVVVNALGNVVDQRGAVVAGARGDAAGEFLDAATLLRTAGTPGGAGVPRAGAHTTLAVVATDAPLTRVELGRIAKVAATGLARRIDPVNTPFDGDVVFAVSTAPAAVEITAAEALALGVALRDLLEEAVLRAVAAA